MLLLAQRSSSARSYALLKVRGPYNKHLKGVISTQAGFDWLGLLICILVFAGFRVSLAFSVLALHCVDREYFTALLHPPTSAVLVADIERQAGRYAA